MLLFVLNLLLSIVLGGLIGWQRHHMGKSAGFRTFTLVTVGCMLFTYLSVQAFPADAARIAAQVLTGIGFIGAGIIFHKKDGVEGLTTAAAFWTSAAVGMAIGLGYPIHAAIVTACIFFILSFPDKKILG